jgi:hypothetical protein
VTRGAQDRVLLPFERNATERCDQWFPAPPRSILTCMHLYGPWGVWMVAAYLRAIFDTEESYLPASVFSSEVTMTQCSRFSRPTSPASR